MARTKQNEFANLDVQLAYGIGSPSEGISNPLPNDLPITELIAPYLKPQEEQPTKSAFAGISAPLASNNYPQNVVPIRPLDYTSSFVPHVIPAKDTMTSFPRPIPNGHSNEQVDLLREALKMTESSGNYLAKNKTTSASGAYQNTHDNWGGYGGYAEARFAPKAVQDAKANEDIIKSLRQYNGDPFATVASHMLPAQAKKPWLWAMPSYIRVGRGDKAKTVTIPPVLNYVRKVLKGTPYENQLDAYMAPHLPRGVRG